MASIKKNSRNHKDGEPHALKSRGDIIFETIVVIILAILTLIILYPLYFVVIASFSDAKLVVAGEVWWYPKGVTLENYMQCFTNGDLMLGYRNAFIILILGTATNLFLTILCAYPLSRHDLWGRNGIMIYCTIPMFFGGGLIPTYLMVTQTLGLKNSWWAVILVAGIATYNMIIMRTFFMGIPESLEESATLDGATDLQIFFKIYVPLSTAVIAVIAMYYGVAWWNSWYQSLVFQPSNSLWPLQMVLREVLITNPKSATTDVTSMAEESYTRELVKYCTVVVSTVPILIIYPFLQRYFVKGVMIGAVKG